jgi:hypothetical protein
MGKFQAQTAVEALEYDLRPYVDKSGIIPEPTTQQLADYFEKSRTIAKDVMALKSRVDAAKGSDDPDIDELSEEEINEIVTDLESINVVEMQEQMVQLIADLCSQEPSTEDILGLPFRVRTEFVKWVGQQFRS